jgi:tRNA dimethylallyltransferase
MTSTAGSDAPDASPGASPFAVPGATDFITDLISVIAGPTAVGKTAVGIALARRLGGEILSADSRQVFRGMSVGTSKPTAAEQAQVRHHLLDIADPLGHYTAADFARDGRAVLADLARRRVPPLVVGGSGLYLRALIDGLFTGPGRDQALRALLEARAEHEGVESLHAALAAVDPESAGRLHPNDRVRVIRALEVHAQSGRPLSALAREAAPLSLRSRTRTWILDRPTSDLDARITERCQRIFAGGILDEAAALLAAGLTPAHPAFRTIGYTEAFAAVRGEMTVEAAVAAAERSTRQFARRQRTWFRAQRDAEWLELAADEPAETTAEHILAKIHQRPGPRAETGP